jgi:hypothetical protein
MASAILSSVTALADQAALPDPTPDFEVDLAMSYRQRKRLARFVCF